MCSYYKVTATMTDGKREWEVIVYDGYNTPEEAAKGASDFFRKYTAQNLAASRILIERYSL